MMSHVVCKQIVLMSHLLFLRVRMTPTQMTKAVIYNYILYYLQETIHSKHICKNVHG